MSFKLGFIGGGNMSTAIVNGILKNGTHKADDIWVSGPHIEHLVQWKQLGTNVTDKNGEVFSKCDVVFLGVKPSMLATAVTDCLNTMSDDIRKSNKSILFVSMLAGITLHELRKALETLSKNVRIVRIMPNTPATVGGGACLYVPEPSVTPEECTLVEKLMNSCGVTERVTEKLMDSLGSLVGCGPAYMYIVIEALADGAVKLGAPRAQAQRLAAQVVMGSGLMVLQSGKHPGVLKDEVCSPGGSTIAGVAMLEEGRIRSSFIKALEASAHKTKELGNK